MKNKDIIQRIDELRRLVEEKQLEEEEPIDPLSASLHEFCQEMAELDEDGITALCEQSVDENGESILTPERVMEFVKAWADFKH